MDRRLALLLSFSLFSFFAQAQYSLKDTFKHYLSREPDFYISLDGRNSFVRDRPAIIDGVRFGLSYGGKIRLLIGLYDLRTPITRNYIYKQGSAEEEIRTQRFDLFYTAITLDYVPFRNKRWKIAVPLQTGFGWGNRKEATLDNTMRVDRDFNFIPLEISVSASYNILDWLSAGAGLGYRYAVFSNSLSGDFSAPIYTYGISIDPEILYNRYLKQRLSLKRP
jgi:hypothetical protein